MIGACCVDARRSDRLEELAAHIAPTVFARANRDDAQARREVQGLGRDDDPVTVAALQQLRGAEPDAVQRQVRNRDLLLLAHDSALGRVAQPGGDEALLAWRAASIHRWYGDRRTGARGDRVGYGLIEGVVNHLFHIGPVLR